MSAERVLVLAESGAGKSTAIETLNPTETFIINVAGKSLPFKGWKSKYSEWSKEKNPKGNMYNSSKSANILACMDYINASRPEIKNLVVDDLFYMAAFELFDRAKESGYNKFTDIAMAFKQVATRPQSYRDDLMVFYLTHPDESVDIDGRRIIKSKLTGKMVENQLNFEGLFEKVLYARPRRNADKTMSFGFETRTDGVTPAKTPKGLFEAEFIPNDLQYVRESILKY